MADLISDGNIRVYWLSSVPASPSAPTTTELNAGLRLDTVMTPDGLDIGVETADVDTSSLSSTINTALPGRLTYSVMLKLKKQTSGDTAYTTLVYGAAGALVVRRTLAAGTAWATAQACEVYPSSCGGRSRLYGPNTAQMYNVPLKITGLVIEDAAVA
jgi:hypothetical protein